MTPHPGSCGRVSRPNTWTVEITSTATELDVNVIRVSDQTQVASLSATDDTYSGSDIVLSGSLYEPGIDNIRSPDA